MNNIFFHKCQKCEQMQCLVERVDVSKQATRYVLKKIGDFLSNRAKYY